VIGVPTLTNSGENCEPGSENTGVTTIPNDWDLDAAARATEDAMLAGADVIYQACFVDGGWRGFADFVERQPDGSYEVHSHGGTRPTGRDAVEWAREAVDRGAGEILLTSIDRDGTGNGFELELTSAIARAVPVPVIASGGAGTPAHFADAFAAGASAALAASVFHFGSLSVGTVKEECARRGFPMRWPLEDVA